MSTSGYIIWIIEILIASGILYGAQFLLRRKDRPVLRTVIFWFKFLLIPGTSMLYMTIQSAFTYHFEREILALYVALVGDVAASTVEYVVRRIRGRKEEESGRKPCRQVLLLAMSLIISFCYLAYGIWNATSIRMNATELKVEGLERSHRFAVVSDIHAGSAQPLDTIRDMCQQINAEDPEFVILVGDITDVYTTYEDMVTTYQILSEIRAPKYYIYGNHDRQPDADAMDGRTYTDEQLIQEVEKAGFRILVDEYVRVTEDIVLLGREVYGLEERKAWGGLENPYKGSGALIVADHEPLDREQLESEDAFLQVSGHTHAGGQIWPNRFLYWAAQCPTQGVYDYPNKQVLVSAGASSWRVPLRTESQCEWELVTIR